ncbi:MAG: DNA-directed RNA polymerase subunit alpha [Patescibacteria group bacterium]|jgi:DNA-directed RNA polymerase subunit alpha
MEIQLPSQITNTPIAEHRTLFTISPCYPGYGTTLGNALRRVLLSSIPGGAIVAFKIKGVDHEFSTIKHVKEDMVDVMLNLKQVRLKVFSDEPVEFHLVVTGKKKVQAKHFEKHNEVEVVNPDQVIATLTDAAAKLDMTVLVQKGIGYWPVEMRENEKLDVGYIAVDAVYTPIKNVNFKIEHVRVEQMTNYDKLMLDISTDGSISPQEALTEACSRLVNHFNLIQNSVTTVAE